MDSSRKDFEGASVSIAGSMAQPVPRKLHHASAEQPVPRTLQRASAEQPAMVATLSMTLSLLACLF